jgi:hypothetical protein
MLKCRASHILQKLEDTAGTRDHTSVRYWPHRTYFRHCNRCCAYVPSYITSAICNTRGITAQQSSPLNVTEPRSHRVMHGLASLLATADLILHCTTYTAFPRQVDNSLHLQLCREGLRSCNVNLAVSVVTIKLVCESIPQ